MTLKGEPNFSALNDKQLWEAFNLIENLLSAYLEASDSKKVSESLNSIWKDLLEEKSKRLVKKDRLGFENRKIPKQAEIKPVKFKKLKGVKRK